jgi:hypothetical protein
MKVSATDEVANDAAVRKGGFPNASSQMIHNSYQTALPGPLNVTPSTTSSADHPIPALPAFKAWDMVDGITGLGPELLHEVGLTSTKLFASLAVDCAAHPTATAMFESMILRSSSQWMALIHVIWHSFCICCHYPKADLSKSMLFFVLLIHAMDR